MSTLFPIIIKDVYSDAFSSTSCIQNLETSKDHENTYFHSYFYQLNQR